MATEATGEVRLTVYQEESDGVQTRYSIRFALGYLSKDDIFIYTGEHGDYETQIAYNWINDTEYELTTPLPAGTVFNVRRVVKRDGMLYKFVTASLHPQRIDDAYLQLLMIAQELMDGFGDRDGLGNIKNLLDMRGYNITNMADARDGYPQDAVTKNQLDTNYAYVLAQYAAIDAAVAATAEDVLETEENAALAELAYQNALNVANSVHIEPMDGLSWIDNGEEVPNELRVDILKQPEASQAVGSDYALISTNGTLRKVKIENILSTGGAYDIRGSVVLDDNSSTGTITDNVLGQDYSISVNVFPSPEAAVGQAYTVVEAALNNSITGTARDWNVGDVLMWGRDGWIELELAVRSWQGKVGEVEVELGDISTDVVHMGSDDSISLTEILETLDATTVKRSETEDKMYIPVSTEDAAGLPEAGSAFYDSEDEVLKIGTGTTWSVSGSGGAVAITHVDSDFTVVKRNIYGIDLETNALAYIAANVDDDFALNDWFGIADAYSLFESKLDKHCIVHLMDTDTNKFAFDETGLDADFIHYQRNAVYIFQVTKVVGNVKYWNVTQSSYGTDAEYVQNQIELSQQAYSKHVANNVGDSNDVIFTRVGNVVNVSWVVATGRVVANATDVVNIPAGYRPISSQIGMQFPSTALSSATSLNVIVWMLPNTDALRAYLWDVSTTSPRFHAMWLTNDPYPTGDEV